MKSLILVAHGSRREASNQEVRRLVELLARTAGHGFGRVSCAFLELTSPTLPEAMQQAVGAGARELVLLPYFLAAGRHVAHDIPALVERQQQIYPELNIRVAPYLGAAMAEVSQLLLGLAARA